MLRRAGNLLMSWPTSKSGIGVTIHVLPEGRMTRHARMIGSRKSAAAPSNMEHPPAPYFRDCLSATDLDLNIEVIHSMVSKEGFYHFCSTLSPPIPDIMHHIPSFDTHQCTVNITINSFNTELSKEAGAKFFSSIRRPWPEGNNQLAKAEEMGGNSDPGAAWFFQVEVRLNKEGFLQQFQDDVFFSYMKLKRQEIRNLADIIVIMPGIVVYDEQR
ncbi:vacuolar ATP synthase subunit d [Laccaria bicolor S238N-H82]|uniref:Vacuolar ATP synthase subunit d n=1 Tax=Laccaria bicolor (strain S238N-H82 / ATCC MYA-4686) TaxID=486041 RepID=B0CPD5_LACBS|nr:vacuolar ATP synthase subunit d [Laccaria bicolor S238N-H82]EDR14941.1 vacuolar ATP synthase subunit d [Laccaria bicolor S238N-H82]|eukprot:XP_001873149.1 vacuolar ATP synthase subunit d [Laccaria bicolor S238N-H82]